MKKFFAIILCAATALLAASCNKDTVKEGDFVTYDLVYENLSGSTFDIAAIEIVRTSMKTAMVLSIGFGDDGVYSYTANLDNKAKTACDAVYANAEGTYAGGTDQTINLVRKVLGDKPVTITLATYKFTHSAE